MKNKRLSVYSVKYMLPDEADFRTRSIYAFSEEEAIASFKRAFIKNFPLCDSTAVFDNLTIEINRRI